MRLLIIRHAQSANNAGALPLVADPPLTGTGERQAQRLAAARGVLDDLDLLYVSPMRRTLQSAAPVAAATGLQPRVFTGLHEWGGIWEERDGIASHLPGLTRDEMSAIIPDLFVPEDVLESGWWTGEIEANDIRAALDLSRRNALRFLDYLRESYPDAPKVAIITHGGFGSNLIEAALGIDQAPEHARFEQHNTGHALIEFDGKHALMRWHNRIDHLAGDLVTM